MSNLILDELYVWEVCTYEGRLVDEETGEIEIDGCIDSGYYVTTDYLEGCNTLEEENAWYEKLIAESGIPVSDCVVQVYHARTATLSVFKNNTVEVYEADCATGYSGSPVYERVVK